MFGSYQEFFPYYVAMHSQPLTRRLRVVGTLSGLALALVRPADRPPPAAGRAAGARLRRCLAEPLADRERTTRPASVTRCGHCGATRR